MQTHYKRTPTHHMKAQEDRTAMQVANAKAAQAGLRVKADEGHVMLETAQKLVEKEKVRNHSKTQILY